MAVEAEKLEVRPAELALRTQVPALLAEPVTWTIPDPLKSMNKPRGPLVIRSRVVASKLKVFPPTVVVHRGVTGENGAKVKPFHVTGVPGTMGAKTPVAAGDVAVTPLKERKLVATV